jgi:hypothetical protein
VCVIQRFEVGTPQSLGLELAMEGTCVTAIAPLELQLKISA